MIARFPCTFAMMLALLLTARVAGAGDSIPEVEKDLSATMKEMESIRGELDRLEELAAFPRATGIRIEVERKGNAAAPVRSRLLVQGTVEDEHEWSDSDRESFAGRISIPLVVQLPWLPGTYPARLELFHPSWKVPAAADFRIEVRKGEIGTLRLLLVHSPGKPTPSLAPARKTSR